jgi:hypothetical protein
MTGFKEKDSGNLNPKWVLTAGHISDSRFFQNCKDVHKNQERIPQYRSATHALFPIFLN